METWPELKVKTGEAGDRTHNPLFTRSITSRISVIYFFLKIAKKLQASTGPLLLVQIMNLGGVSIFITQPTIIGVIVYFLLCHESVWEQSALGPFFNKMGYQRT